MRLLVFLIFTCSIFAQDSAKVFNLSHVSSSSLVSNNELSLVTPTKKSLIELKLNREWKRKSIYGLNNNFQKSSVINYKQKEPNFLDTDLFLVVVGSAVVFGATAAYFKLESDNLYEKYGHTDNKSKLDKIERYDLYSGLALGALEINFGFLIYKFLTD